MKRSPLTWLRRSAVSGPPRKPSHLGPSLANDRSRLRIPLGKPILIQLSVQEKKIRSRCGEVTEGQPMGLALI